MPDMTVVGVIWHYLTIVTKWIMDNLLVLNAILAIVIVFSEKRSQDRVDVAFGALFYPCARFYSLSVFGTEHA